VPTEEESRRIGNYQILEKLGSGSVGTVYKAKQITMDRLVALKILNPKHAQDPEYVRRFVEEAKAAGRVNHANVCQVYEVGQDRGLYFFSMELVDGPTVEQLLKERGKLSVSEALNIARQVAMALQAAYMNGLVHRDVKPANILISSSGVAKLVDLGLAKDLSKPAQQELGLAGTPYYMPPEQSQGLEVDIRSDIYSLGATLYHMLVGRPPYTGPHATAVMVKHAAEPLTPPSEVDPSIPKRVSAVVARMMAKKPDERYETPEDLVADLDAAIAGKESPAARARQGQAPVRRRLATGSHAPVRRARSALGAYVVPAIIGGGVLLAALALAFVSFGGPDPGMRRAEENIARAQALLAQDTPEALAEASRLAREALALIPPTTVALPKRQAAERLRDQAELRRAELDVAALEKEIIAALEGRTSSAEAEAAIAALERRYSDGLAPAASRDRVAMACARARSRLAAASAGSVKKETEPTREAPAAPRPGSASEVLKTEVERLLGEEKYSEAMELIDVTIAAVGPEDRRAAEALKGRALAAVERAFAKVTEDASREAKAGRFEAAESVLRLARGRFGFAPYDRKIASQLSALAEKKAAAAAAPPPPSSPSPPSAPAADPAEAAIVKGIDAAVGLIQEGKNEEARAALRRLEEQWGRTEAFKRRKDEVQALLELAK